MILARPRSSGSARPPQRRAASCLFHPRRETRNGAPPPGPFCSRASPPPADRVTGPPSNPHRRLPGGDLPASAPGEGGTSSPGTTPKPHSGSQTYSGGLMRSADQVSALPPYGGGAGGWPGGGRSGFGKIRPGIFQSRQAENYKSGVRDDRNGNTPAFSGAAMTRSRPGPNPPAAGRENGTSERRRRREGGVYG